MKTRTLTRSAIAGSVFAVLAGSYVGFAGSHIAATQAGVLPQAALLQQPAAAVADGAAAITNFSGIVARYGPAVVNISVTSKAHQYPMAAQDEDSADGEAQDPLSQMFPGLQQSRPQGRTPPPPQHALGSGFIIRSDGTILTNAHVVDGAQEVIVKLTDRREFKAKVIGIDAQSDVAVLKINASNLPVVRLGDPAVTRVGDPVLAIGSPYGFENTATSGIVSAKSRTLPEGSSVPFLQTDVAVNPGNSGGPLFNLQGEVIGINSQIYSRTGGYQGLSFAIPIDVASNVEQQLEKSGKVSRGRLGITIQDLNQALGESFGLSTVHGALVSMVDKAGPAASAGIEAGDVILRVNGHDINYASDLPVQIALMQPGTEARLELIRAGKPLVKNVALGATSLPHLASNAADASSHGKLGVVVRPLVKSEQQEAGVASGLLVEQAVGPAARAGIAAGDVIVAVNGVPATSVAQLQQMVHSSGKKMALLVQRDNARIFVPVDLG